MQCLHQARIFIDREFEEICEEANIADKLQTLDVMCAQQGFDGSANAEFVVACVASEILFELIIFGLMCVGYVQARALESLVLQL